MSGDDVGPNTAIEVVAPGKSVYAGLALIFALAPGLILVLSLTGVNGLPVERLPVHLALIVALELPVLLGLAWISTRRKVVLSESGLDIRATFYRKQVALTAIDLERARVVDLREKRELRPRLKTNGFSLPGFAAGHFRDAGGHKLFCLVTRPVVVWLPLADGARVLLSAARPAAALESIRKRAGH